MSSLMFSGSRAVEQAATFRSICAEMCCCAAQRQGEGPVDVPPLLPVTADDLKDQQKLAGS